MAGTRSLGQALEHHELKTRIVELETKLQAKEETIISDVKTEIQTVYKTVEVVIEKPVETIIEKIKEVEKFIDKEIHIIPKWVFGVIAIETLLIIVMLVKLI